MPKLDSMCWFSHRRRTGGRKALRTAPASRRRRVLPSPCHPHLRRNGIVCCCVQHTAQWRWVMPTVNGDDSAVFPFCPRWPWPLTFDLDIRSRARFLYNAPNCQFHRPTFSRSEVIVRTNKRTNWQTNKRRWKHPPRFATLRRWVKIDCTAAILSTRAT